MNTTTKSIDRFNWTRLARWVSWGTGILILILATATTSHWLPVLNSWLDMRNQPVAASNSTGSSIDEPPDHDDHHGHDHPGHDDDQSLHLSEQARASMHLKLGEVQVGKFERTISVPGIIIERRGQSRLDVTAPMTGVVTRVHVLEGEAVSPGAPLFDIRLTHEEIVQAQADLLKTAEEVDVMRREVARLEAATRQGAIAGKSLLERTYELQRQEAIMRAQRQALRLHGLSAQQVEQIVADRRLIASLTTHAPTLEELGPEFVKQTVFQVQELRIDRGQHVEAGATIAVLGDHSRLLIQGTAFERDAKLISQAAESQRPFSATLDSQSDAPVSLNELCIHHLANRIDPETRTLRFFVCLQNSIRHESQRGESHKFIEWEYKPGQRLTLEIPVEEWTDRIVLPLDAVAQEGAENYIFRVNGDHFDRQAVRVEYRDPKAIVIANDGSLFEGESIALNGAAQLQLALKNQAGGAIDPHAGHQH